MKITDLLNRSALLTYLGIAASLAGIASAIGQNIKIALLALIIAGVCDLFDGKFAERFCRTQMQKQFGVQIDSLADMVNFVALPVTILFSTGSLWINMPVAIFYTLCAVTRLAHFNVLSLQRKDDPLPYYTGLPVTYVSLILPTMWIIFQKTMWADSSIFYSISLFAAACFFISNIKMRKPGKAASIFFALLAIGAFIIIVTA